jgi:hypothetical protein
MDPVSSAGLRSWCLLRSTEVAQLADSIAVMMGYELVKILDAVARPGAGGLIMSGNTEMWPEGYGFLRGSVAKHRH